MPQMVENVEKGKRPMELLEPDAGVSPNPMSHLVPLCKSNPLFEFQFTVVVNSALGQLTGQCWKVGSCKTESQGVVFSPSWLIFFRGTRTVAPGAQDQPRHPRVKGRGSFLQTWVGAGALLRRRAALPVR